MSELCTRRQIVKFNDQVIAPLLPPEIECIIFTLAYDPLDLKASAALMLVAQRVRSWICTLIYRVVDYYQSSKPRPDLNRTGGPKIEEIGQYVHVLIMGTYHDDPAIAKHFVKHCPNLRTLANWQANFQIGPILPSLEALTDLRYISTDFVGLSKEELISPVFTRLSRLELIWPTRMVLQAVRAYSELTHLMIEDPADRDLSLIQDILRSCSQLQVLILTDIDRSSYADDSTTSAEIRQMYKEDVRMVVIDAAMFCVDVWRRGLHGGYTIWTFAEYIITARKKKYLSGDLQDDIFPQNFDWPAHLTEEGRKWYGDLPLAHMGVTYDEED